MKTTSGEKDYKQLDASRQWKQKAEWLEDAEAAGFKYITEMVHKTYLRFNRNIAKTAEWLGMSRDGTTKILYHVGVKPRAKGGRNYAKLNHETVRALRIGWEDWDYDGTKNEYVGRFMVDNNLTCHPDTVKMALDGKTWVCA